MICDDAGATAGDSPRASRHGLTLADKQARSIKAAIEVPAEQCGETGIESHGKVLQVLVGALGGIKNEQSLRRAIGTLRGEVGSSLVQPGAQLKKRGRSVCGEFYLQGPSGHIKQVDATNV